MTLPDPAKASLGSSPQVRAGHETPPFLHLVTPPRDVSASPISLAAPLLERRLAYERLREIKQVLRNGTPQPDHTPVLPFQFRIDGKAVMVAEAAGVEGFLFSERLFAREYGSEMSASLTEYYLRYTLSLFSPLGWTHAFCNDVRALASSPGTPQEKYETFKGIVEPYVRKLQAEASELDAAHWSHGLRAYHVFTRATSLPARRGAFGMEIDPEDSSEKWFESITEADFELLTLYGFNALRVMGTYPCGQVNAKGTAGGSPFSVRRYEVDAALGSEDAVRRVVALAEKHGIRSIFEFVPNHTAVDADLVQLNPQLYVHRLTRPDDETGYFHLDHPLYGDVWIRHGAYRDKSGRHYFTDTLQLDHSNPATRDLIVLQADILLKRYGLHGLRIDMAHHMLRKSYLECWGDELSDPLPEREFLEEFVSRLKGNHPDVAFIAEALGGNGAEFDKFSEVGFDLVYNQDDMPRRGGHQHIGWFAALLSRDPARIRRALRRAEFLQWQHGGADSISFVGQHDRPAPWRELGSFVWGAMLLSALKPGALCVYAGADAHFEAPCAEDGKMVSFNNPATIEWTGVFSPFGEHVHRALLDFKRLTTALGEVEFRTLEPAKNEHGTRPDEPWVGFVVQARERPTSKQRFMVLVNLADHPTQCTVEDRELGIDRRIVEIPPCGPEGQLVITVGWRLHSLETAISQSASGVDGVPPRTPA